MEQLLSGRPLCLHVQMPLCVQQHYLSAICRHPAPQSRSKKLWERLPDLNGAADIIDRIRNRAGLGKLPQSTRSSKEALLQAYMDERRMELAFEGQRWYDLCRLNKVEEVMNAVYAKDSGRHAQENLFNENSYLLAIPQGAIDQNENLIQNPGY